MKLSPRTKTSWATETGYIVAVCKTPETIYQITRPGESRAFAYTPDKQQVRQLIQIDMDESA